MTINKSSTSINYIEQLTWLRGFAAFLVIVSHTLRATEVEYLKGDEASSNILMTLLDLGSFGVVLFFVLSGCTLYISNGDRSGFGNVIKFYIKRVFRIWPAFVVSLVVYIFLGFYFSGFYVEPQGYWIEKQFLTPYSFADVIMYLTLTFNVFGPSELFNNAYWSLPVEFQYYIIFPLIIFSLKTVGPVGPAVIAGALYFYPKLGFFEFTNDIFFLIAFSFCGGVLVGYVYKKSCFRLGFVAGATLLFLMVLIVSAIRNAYIPLPDIPIVSGEWNWYGGIAILSVYVVLITKTNFHNKVELFLKHYGTISYSTYLYHNLFIAIATLLIINFEIHSGNIRLLITFVFALVASYFAATYSYKYIEEPFISLGRKFVKKSVK